MNDINKLIRDLIADEEEAIQCYDKALEKLKTSYPELQKTIIHIREEEYEHIQELYEHIQHEYEA